MFQGQDSRDFLLVNLVFMDDSFLLFELVDFQIFSFSTPQLKNLATSLSIFDSLELM